MIVSILISLSETEAASEHDADILFKLHITSRSLPGNENPSVLLPLDMKGDPKGLLIESFSISSDTNLLLYSENLLSSFHILHC